MHPLLEFFPLIIFFSVYSFYGIYWATATLIIASAIQILFLFITKKPIPKKIWILALLMTIMGGMTIYFQDDAFLKWKVTVVYTIFGIVLLASDKFYQNNLIKKALGEALELPEKIWAKMNVAWAMFFIFIAILNIYIAYNFELDIWVKFKVFGTMILMFLFIVFNMISIYKYLPKDDENKDDAISTIKTNDE